MAIRFEPSDVASKIAVSIGIGLLVGIEREWSNKDLGARTFALTSLLGTLAVLFSPAMAIISLVGIFLIIVFANVRSLMVDRSLEATTSAALLVIFVLGALVGQGHRFTPVASAILMTMLLTWKVELRRFAGGLQPEEIRSGVLLGLLGLVAYPILPNRFIDRWGLMVNLPIIHRNLRNGPVSKRITFLTIIVSSLGLMILLFESWLGARRI